MKKRTKFVTVELPECLFYSLVTISTFYEKKFGNSLPFDSMITDAVYEYAEKIFTKGIEECLLCDECAKKRCGHCQIIENQSDPAQIMDH